MTSKILEFQGKDEGNIFKGFYDQLKGWIDWKFKVKSRVNLENPWFFEGGGKVDTIEDFGLSTLSTSKSQKIFASFMDKFQWKLTKI